MSNADRQICEFEMQTVQGAPFHLASGAELQIISGPELQSILCAFRGRDPNLQQDADANAETAGK